MDPSAQRRSDRPRRPLTPGRLLAFTALTLLLFLAGLEGVLQVLAASQGPQHRLPDDGSVAPPDPAAFRVIAVGDSWVYGAESEPDEAFIEVFRRAAAARLGKPVQVYNLGVSASNSSQALVSLANLIEPVQPHLVVALTGANNRLHDRGVMEAARILGEDVRTVPGLSALSGLRTVRLARLIWINLLAPDTVQSTAAAASTGEPVAPEPVASTIVRLPWWDLYVARRWDDALLILRDTKPPGDAPHLRGLQLAWEALLLARTHQLDAAESAALAALELGGDDVAAHEARALVAEQRGRGLHALHHRALAATSTGNAVLRDLARGRVLLQLEAWEPARSWLLAASRAVPGQLEALIALASLPPTVRTEEVEKLLFEGPRGLVSRVEYMRWHLASSAMVDRAVASLDDEEPDEPFDVALARAEGRALAGDEPAAAAAMLALLTRASTPEERDQALGGAYLYGADPALPESAPGPVETRGPRTLLGLAAAYDRASRCSDAVLSAQRALDLGVLPAAIERVAGGCLPRHLTWTLGEMVFERPRPFDRHRLITGSAADPAAPPSVPFWQAFRERRFDDLPADAAKEWRALAKAFADDVDDPLLDELAEGAVVADPAVAALAVGYGLWREQRAEPALRWLGHAAESEGEPWARALARGIGAAIAGDWTDAQRHLHAAEAAAPRQLESLEALHLIPPPSRTIATREAVDLAPVGLVPGARWVEWYLDQGHTSRAELALRWSWFEDGPLGAERSLIARAEVIEERGQRAEAVRSLDDLIARLPRELPTEAELLCRAVSLRYDLGAEGDEQPPPAPTCRAPRADPRAPKSALAARWIERLADPDGAHAKEAEDAGTDVLVRQLDAMRRLSESLDADFVALTYPFPSGHHAEVREVVVAGGAARGYETLDLYGAFQDRFARPAWEAMRTPEDHVNAKGYALMGQLLTEWAVQRGLVPAQPTAAPP